MVLKVFINEQPDPDIWSYEVQELAKLVLAGEYQVFYQRLDTTLKVMELLENTRKQAGILFPGD